MPEVNHIWIIVHALQFCHFRWNLGSAIDTANFRMVFINKYLPIQLNGLAVFLLLYKITFCFCWFVINLASVHSSLIILPSWCSLKLLLQLLQISKYGNSFSMFKPMYLITSALSSLPSLLVQEGRNWWLVPTWPQTWQQWLGVSWKLCTQG